MASRKVTAKNIEPAVDDQQLVNDNPDHDVELVEEITMDVHDNPDAVIDGVLVFEVTSLPGGEVLIDFVDGSTQIVTQEEIPSSLNPFHEGGIGMNQIPVYLETPTS